MKIYMDLHDQLALIAISINVLQYKVKIIQS